MAKRVALKDEVMLDTSDLSDFARSVRFSSEHAQIDVSGFNALGANEYLAGATTQSVTIEFFGSYGTGEVHSVLYPLHKNRTSTALKWRPDQTAPVGTTNPELRGNGLLYTYGPGATRGDVDTLEAVFHTVDSAGFQFFTT